MRQAQGRGPELHRCGALSMKAVIYGCEGTSLTAAERELFARVKPFGLILFARNIDNPVQVMELTAEFRACVGSAEAQVLIDQEGGRVARLKLPHWQELPPAEKIGALYLKDKAEGLASAKLLGRRLASMLLPLGITIDCTPVLDLRVPGADEVIGDRAFSSDPLIVAPLARAVCDGLLAGGVYPVIKHIPGHGRARADSHKELPVVDTSRAELEAMDFVSFTKLSDMPFAMTGHILYSALDPHNCATFSPEIIGKVIRSRIGFDGLLMSDDLYMSALSGPMVERARKSWAAGCDLALYCKHDIDDMNAIAEIAPDMAGETLARWQRAQRMLRPLELYDAPLIRAEFDRLMSHVG